MGATLQVIGSFFAAALGWIVLEFIARPARRFFDLRGEIIRRCVEFSNVKARFKPIPDDSGAHSGEMETITLSPEEIKKLDDVKITLRDLASQMRAFALNETLALWLVRLRYDPFKASEGLFGLSNIFDEYGVEKQFHKKTLADALRIECHVI